MCKRGLWGMVTVANREECNTCDRRNMCEADQGCHSCQFNTYVAVSFPCNDCAVVGTGDVCKYKKHT